MIYRELCGHKVSQLGFGAMRLPVIDGDDGNIDVAAATEMVEYAFDHGINYFDTAYGYHNGTSEVVMGQALSCFPRDEYLLASKFPGYELDNFGKVEEIFEEQLRKTGAGHFDFYLCHNVCELNIDQYLDDEQYGTVSYLLAQKKAGRIGHLGFSAHASQETFLRFLDAFGDVMEFCQIQLNYLDWDFQNARDKVAVLNERNIPIIVMEPLRGGNLVALEEEDAALLEPLRPGVSTVDWAFRYLQGIDGISVILSGMSSLAQLQDNVEIFGKEIILDEAQTQALHDIAAKMIARVALPCTKCRYCVSYCPQGLDIPWLIELFNEHNSRDEGKFIAPMALAAMPADKHPAACIGCGSCQRVCPQKLPIPDALSVFAYMLG